MRTFRRPGGLLTCLLFLTVGTLTATPADTTVGYDTVLQRFLSRQDDPLVQYRAYRRLEARNERFEKEGALEAWTELTPDGGFRFDIVRETGSDYIRGKVLRPLLVNEAKMVERGDVGRGAFTPENYELHAEGLAEPGVMKLVVKPRRRDLLLVDGALFIRSDTADLLRVEGQLSKNPSFWTRQVRIVRQYGRVGGVRVPLRVYSTAHIRMAGVSTLSMVYEYETVNGIDVRDIE